VDCGVAGTELELDCGGDVGALVGASDGGGVADVVAFVHPARATSRHRIAMRTSK
jgi:hypothetical protein